MPNHKSYIGLGTLSQIYLYEFIEQPTIIRSARFMFRMITLCKAISK